MYTSLCGVVLMEVSEARVSMEKITYSSAKCNFFYCYWGGTKSLVLRPLLAYCTSPR
jgi:hypothetical protein